MAMKIAHDAGAPTASVELLITRPLPDFDLHQVAARVPREIDPILASQGFKDLLDEVRSILERELAGKGLEIGQLTGAIGHDGSVHRPGIWLVLREEGAQAHQAMSPAARELVAAVAQQLCSALQLT